jgi:hypothetical protein
MRRWVWSAAATTRAREAASSARLSSSEPAIVFSDARVRRPHRPGLGHPHGQIPARDPARHRGRPADRPHHRPDQVAAGQQDQGIEPRR